MPLVGGGRCRSDSLGGVREAELRRRRTGARGATLEWRGWLAAQWAGAAVQRDREFAAVAGAFGEREETLSLLPAPGAEGVLVGVAHAHRSTEAATWTMYPLGGGECGRGREAAEWRDPWLRMGELTALRGEVRYGWRWPCGGKHGVFGFSGAGRRMARGRWAYVRASCTEQETWEAIHICWCWGLAGGGAAAGTPDPGVPEMAHVRWFAIDEHGFFIEADGGIGVVGFRRRKRGLVVGAARFHRVGIPLDARPCHWLNPRSHDPTFAGTGANGGAFRKDGSTCSRSHAGYLDHRGGWGANSCPGRWFDRGRSETLIMIISRDPA